jgi:hypothetical protein
LADRFSINPVSGSSVKGYPLIKTSFSPLRAHWTVPFKFWSRLLEGIELLGERFAKGLP